MFCVADDFPYAKKRSERNNSLYGEWNNTPVLSFTSNYPLYIVITTDIRRQNSCDVVRSIFQKLSLLFHAHARTRNLRLSVYTLYVYISNNTIQRKITFFFNLRREVIISRRFFFNAEYSSPRPLSRNLERSRSLKLREERDYFNLTFFYFVTATA